jgi:hypothetical protein
VEEEKEDLFILDKEKSKPYATMVLNPNHEWRGFPNVFLDFEVDGEPIGRVEFELFADCPKTSENFRALCTGEFGLGKKGRHLHYKGTKIHKIVPGFMI